ncbi:hypothetical protein GGI24_004286, partial [Coemansia furcata]
MRVDSLLNPAPSQPPPPDHRPSTERATFGEPTLHGRLGRGSYEPALWRQECGLGPPAQKGPRRPNYFGADGPGDDDGGGEGEEHIALGGGHGASESARVHAKHMQLPHPVDRQGPSYYTPGYKDAKHGYHSIRQGAVQGRDAGPRIFVPRPRIVGHGAMSMDKSGDYIQTMPSEHMALGDAPMQPSPSSTYSPCGSTPGTRSSPSFPSEAVFSNPALSPERRVPASHLHPAAAAAAALASMSGRMVDEYDDDDDDELDPYAAAFAAANRAAMSTVSGYAGCGQVTGAHSAPSMAIQPPPAALTCYPPLLPCLANSSPPIAATNLDGDKLGVSHKRKSSQASVVDNPDTKSQKTNASPPVRRHRAKTPAPKPVDCPTDEPAVNWQALEVPEDIWTKALELYDEVKALKKVQNRQPVRKRGAILAALMFILCRSRGYPRTFAEICTAGNTTKRDIGMYYNLMKQVLDKEYTAIQRAKPAEFLLHWCSVLELPPWMAGAASCVYDRADGLAIVQGKCPISVSAACL